MRAAASFGNDRNEKKERKAMFVQMNNLLFLRDGFIKDVTHNILVAYVTGCV